MNRILLYFFLLFKCSIFLHAQPTGYYLSTDLNGTINPDGQNGTYGNNLYEFYQIAAAGSERIKLSFTISEVGMWSNDNIYVYDGPDEGWGTLIGIYNSHNLPPDTIFSTSSYLSIFFETDDIDGGELGWSADYYGVKPAPVVYTTSTGTFTNKSIPVIGYNGYFYSFLIKPIGATNVELTFPDIYLGQNGISSLIGPCMWIYDGENENCNLIGTYSDDNAPPSSIVSSGNALYVQCLVDFIGYDINWTAQYTGIMQNLEATYDYDASGNRLHRNLIYLPVTKSATAKQVSLYENKTKSPKTYTNQTSTGNITIYPNPTNGELKVEIDNFDFTQKSAIYIFNPMGKLIVQKSPVSWVDVFDLSGHPNGLYVMKIVLGDKSSEWKIIKE